MPRKQVTLSGEVHIGAGGVYTTVDALAAMKAIGAAYGLYDHAEEFRDQRVMLEEDGGRPALVVQENISRHGSPLWETVRTVTRDSQQIEQYLAFRDTLRMMTRVDQELERQPPPCPPRPLHEKGKTAYER